MSLLGVGAAVIDIGVRETSAPHHDASERRIALVLFDELGELVGGNVVGFTAWAAIGSKWSGRNTKEDLGIFGRSARDKRHPLVIV